MINKYRRPGPTQRHVRNAGLAGLRFRVEKSGPGESHADTLWWLDEQTVFAGDVAYNGMHAYLADARYESWLGALAALEARLAEDVTLYVGHGGPVGRTVLAAQRRYVETFLDAVAEHAADDAAARRDRVVARMRSLVSDERLLFLMELSIEPVHAALREHRS